MKIVSFYLPQFHEFKENNEWWGKGFTEWVNVKKSNALYKGHNQPRVPLNCNYYDLLDPNTIKWQAEIAKKYGVYGFCFYHYWFDGHMLMKDPMEILYEDKSIDINYCICWANENWTRAWADYSREVLIEQTYGDENDWDKHFYYILKFFKDPRYIYKDGKPVFVIYRPEIIPTLCPMLERWNYLAKRNGLQGICYMSQQCDFDIRKDNGGSLFSYEIEFQPPRVKSYHKSYPIRQMQCFTPLVLIRKLLNKVSTTLGIPIGYYNSIQYSYDGAWKRILSMKPRDRKSIPGAFVDWDNTPRYGEKGSFYSGVTPQKFQKYLTMQIKNAQDNYHQDMIFMFAWNEWGEGGYLEPDTKWGYKMLKAVRDALHATNSFPRSRIEK